MKKANSECFLCDEQIFVSSKRNNLTAIQFEILGKKSFEMGDYELNDEIKGHFDPVSCNINCDAMCHNSCFTSYLDPESLTPLMETYVDTLVTDMIKKGYLLTLTEIRHYLEDQCQGHKFYNHRIKSYLILRFKSNLEYFNPTANKKSIVVYPAYV